MVSLHESQPQDSLQRMTLASLSPTKYCHCLIITLWRRYFVNRWQRWWTIVPVISALIKPLPRFIINHWFMSCLFHFKGEHTSHLTPHPHPLLQAPQQPTEPGDRKWSRETRQPSTRLEPKPPTHPPTFTNTHRHTHIYKHTHTHLQWYTKITRKLHLFSDLSSPEMFFCFAHNCLFPTSDMLGYSFK